MVGSDRGWQWKTIKYANVHVNSLHFLLNLLLQRSNSELTIIIGIIVLKGTTG